MLVPQEIALQAKRNDSGAAEATGIPKNPQAPRAPPYFKSSRRAKLAPITDCEIAMCFPPLWLPVDIRDYSYLPAWIGTSTLVASLRQPRGTSIPVLPRVFSPTCRSRGRGVHFLPDLPEQVRRNIVPHVHAIHR